MNLLHIVRYCHCYLKVHNAFLNFEPCSSFATEIADLELSKEQLVSCRELFLFRPRFDSFKIELLNKSMNNEINFPRRNYLSLFSI